MERVSPHQPEATQEGRSPSVLVVDDDSRVVELLQITLGGRGYRVLTAHDGEEALDSARANHPDILVLDVRLPRRSGVDVCETLRNEGFRNLPIILISGNAATESRLQGLKAGADDYLTKPFSPRELLFKMQRILERNRDRDVLALKTEVLEEEVRRQRDHIREIRTDFKSHLNRLGTVLEKIQELNRNQSVIDLLQSFVSTAVGILDYDAVALLVSDGVTLRPIVHRGLRMREPESLEIDPTSPSAKLLAESTLVHAVDDLALRPDCTREVGLFSAAGLLWVIGVRGAGSDLRAILGVGERSDRQQLDRFDLKLIEALGVSIGTALSNAEAFERTQSAFFETIISLLTSFESRYPWLSGHSERVSLLCVKMGERAGMGRTPLEALRAAALMHNLGAVERHEYLLHATITLSPAERKLRQREASEAAGRLLPAARGGVAEILCHQAEYWDGSGIPDGLRGDQIPIGSRILTIANAYDALTHERPHRPPYDARQAEDLIRARAGKQFDPALVEILGECLGSGA